MARDKICTPFLALASPENKFTVSTIEDMQSRKYLKIGDIVELNGYYTAGDGAGHKRKIEATDDGSGVLLANGLWANIVHNGEVNVSWFGAKGDGETDDTSALIGAHKIAFKNKAKIKYGNSKSYVLKNEETILINNDVDFCNSTIIYDEDFNALYIKLFHIVSDHEIKEYTGSLGDTVSANNPIIQEKNIPENAICFSSSELVEENYTPDYEGAYYVLKDVRNPDIFVYTRGGLMRGGIFNDIKRIEKLYYRDMDSNNVVISNLKFKLNGKNNIFMSKLIFITRDNVTIKNTKIDREYTKVCERRNLIHICQCYNTTVDCLISTDPVNINDTNTSNYEGYILRLDLALDTKIKNVSCVNNFLRKAENNIISDTADQRIGWVWMGGQFVNKLHVSDSELSKVDSHSRMKDLTIERSTLHYFNGQFSGLTSIKDCRIIMNNLSSNFIVKPYGDNTPSYNTATYGSLLIENIEIVSDGSKELQIVYTSPNESSPNFFENITVKGVYSKTPIILRTGGATNGGSSTRVYISDCSDNVTIQPFDYKEYTPNHNITLERCKVGLTTNAYPSASSLRLVDCKLNGLIIDNYYKNRNIVAIENILINDEECNQDHVRSLYHWFGKINVTVDNCKTNSHFLRRFVKTNVQTINFCEVFKYNGEFCMAIRNNVDRTTNLAINTDYLKQYGNKLSNYISSANGVLTIPADIASNLKYRVKIDENGEITLLLTLDGTISEDVKGKAYDITFTNFNYNNRAGTNKIFFNNILEPISFLGFSGAMNGFRITFGTNYTRNSVYWCVENAIETIG